MIDVPTNGLWVTGFKAENFMRLQVVALDEADLGQVVELRGKNEQGKSSMLDGVECVLAGADGAKKQPLRVGAESGFLELQLGEPGEADPTKRVLVRRTFNNKGGSHLTFAAANGAVFPSPQGLLNAIINHFCLDPVGFERAKPAEQRDLLARAAKVDLKRIEDLDGLSRRDYQRRRDLNRIADERATQATAIQYPEGLPPSPIDEADLVGRLRLAGDSNVERERAVALRQTRANEAATLQRRAQVAREDAEDLRRRAAELDVKAEEMDGQVLGILQSVEKSIIPDEVDTTALQAEIAEARRINAAIGERNRRREVEAEAKAAQEQAGALTEALAGYRKEKNDIIAAAAMPVDGLSLGDDGVLWKGVPFEQASGGVKITVSTAIAMACNPQVRVVCVRDGNTLDNDRYRALISFCKERGFQLWVEFVDSNPQSGIILEEGRARRAVPQAPAAQPALAL